MAQTQFDKFVAPARRAPGLWRLFFGISLIGVLWLVGGVSVILWIGLSNPSLDTDQIMRGLTPTGMGILFATFGGLLVGSMLAARIHKRSVLSIFGPRKVFWRDFSRVIPIAATLYVGFVAIWLVFYDPVQNMEPATWLRVLIIGLAGLALQTLAEEAAFRGYLMQQLAARFRSPLVYMLVPSVAFGAMHYTPEAGPFNAWLIILATGVFGLVAADLTRRTGSIGAAWALHFVNNIVAVLILAVDGTLPGLALWLTPYSVLDESIMTRMLLLDIGMLILTWTVLIRFLKR